jgi:hypothetical protein
MLPSLFLVLAWGSMSAALARPVLPLYHERQVIETRDTNNRCTGVRSDLNQSMSMALAMVEIFGMGERLTATLPLGGGHSPAAVVACSDVARQPRN